MDITPLVTDYFWNVATQLVNLIIPIISIYIVMRILMIFIVRGAE